MAHRTQLCTRRIPEGERVRKRNTQIGVYLRECAKKANAFAVLFDDQVSRLFTFFRFTPIHGYGQRVGLLDAVD